MLDVFYRDFQVDPKIHMEIQGTQNSLTNSEKEKQTCRTCTAKNRELRTEINPHIYIQLIICHWKNYLFYLHLYLIIKILLFRIHKVIYL